MKQIIALIIIALLLFASCGESGKSEPAVSTAAQQSKAPSQVTYPESHPQYSEAPEEPEEPDEDAVVYPTMSPTWDGFSSEGEQGAWKEGVAVRSGEWIYYLDCGDDNLDNIYRVKIDGTGKQLIYEDEYDENGDPIMTLYREYGFSHIELADGKLLVCAAVKEGGYYGFLDITGDFPKTEITLVFPDGIPTTSEHGLYDGIKVTPNGIYYTCLEQGKIYLADRDGSNIRVILDGVHDVWPSEDGIIYEKGEKRYKADFDGKNPVEIPAQIGFPRLGKYEITHNDDYYNYDDYEALDTTTGESFKLPIKGYLYWLEHIWDGDDMYFATTEGVYRVSTKTWEGEKISDFKEADAISIIDDWIFFRLAFYDYDGMAIMSPTMRMKKDGSDLQRMP